MTEPGSSADALLGHTLADRYRLTRKIGEGGMGAVYEAEHVLIGKPVAVKVLRDKYLDRPEVAQRLVQEARLASSIRHEHIVDITDSGATVDGRTYVVMEHLSGQSLAELLRREGALPEARVIGLGLQAASALAAAHARGIIHRDVKPENLFLVDKEGEDFVKVLDFGISKTLRPEGLISAESLRLTSTGMVLGTPLYMSPEQARGEEGLDQRIDVYALGVILYECLTGSVPFFADNYLGVIAQVIAREVPSPRSLRPDLSISEAMDRVVQKAMAKDRTDRYDSMEALCADLTRVARGAAVEAPRRRRRSDRARTGLWLLIAGAVAGTALLLTLDHVTRPTAIPAPTPLAAAPLRPVPPAASETVVLHVVTTPPGAEIRQGARVFGMAPRDVRLPRSRVPVELQFRLPGYLDGAARIVPTTDDTVRVELSPRARPRHPRAPTPALRETLPNPY